MHGNLKIPNYYYHCLWFSFLMPNWVFTSYTITLSISVLPDFRVLQLPVACDQAFFFFAHRKRGIKNA